MSASCPECGARLSAGRACVDDFHQLLAWENEFPPLGEVHHLMVLAYYLQHPSRYSPEGLIYSQGLLKAFIVDNQTPEAMRRRNRDQVNSRHRAWKLTARPGAQGRYEREMAWTMRAADVVAGGPERYRENVRAWAHSIWEILRHQLGII